MEQPPFPLEALSDHLLIAVFKQLAQLSPYSLDACTGVCHRFYRLAFPIKYRNVHVSNDDWCRIAKRLSRKGSQLPLFVRRITLSDRHAYGSDDAKPLMDVVRATKKLKEIEIYGSYQFSQPLLDLINSQFPDIQIEYHAEYPREDEGMYFGWLKGPLEGGMNGFCSPQLYDLSIDSVWSLDPGGPEVVRRSLENIVKNSPNLRHFTKGSANDAPLELNLSRSDRLPILESFEHIPISYNGLQTWGEATGWKSLYILKLTGVGDVPAFAAYPLPRLQYLTLSGHQMADVYDKLPTLGGPVRFLSIALDEDQLPYQFLAQFTNTLEELMIFRSRDKSNRGYSAHDMRRLNKTCPLLRKLYIRPYVNERSPAWSRDILEELNHYQMLQCLVLGSENHSKLQPSPDQCLDSYNIVRGNNPSSKLQQLAHVHEYEASSCDYFPRLVSGAKVSCIATEDGAKIVEKPRKYYYDYDTKIKNNGEAASRSLLERPFAQKLAYIWGDRSEREILWTMKQLGPGPSWAETELLPKGLIKQEHLEKDYRSSNMNYREEIAKIAKDEGELKVHRELMKEELKYWNRVWQGREKYGKFSTLYDILYPRGDVD